MLSQKKKCNSTPPIIPKIKAISPTRSFLNVTVNGSWQLAIGKGLCVSHSWRTHTPSLPWEWLHAEFREGLRQFSNGPHQIPLVYPLPWKLLWCLIVEAMCVLRKIESICLWLIWTELITLLFSKRCSLSRQNPQGPLHTPPHACQHLSSRKFSQPCKTHYPDSRGHFSPPP